MANFVTIEEGVSFAKSPQSCKCCWCVKCRGADCASCPDLKTPNQMWAAFSSVQASANCVFLVGSPFYVYKLFSSLSGMSFNCPQSDDPCKFTKVLDPGILSVKRCVGDGSGCDACTPDEAITVSVTLVIEISGGASPSVYFIVETSDPGIGTITVEPRSIDSVSGSGSGCCSVYTQTYATCDTGLDAWNNLCGGSVTTGPCSF